MRRSRYVTLGLALVVPALVLGPAAAGVTTIGQTAPTTVGTCSGPVIFVQAADVGSPSYATTAGVITSWSVVAGTDAGSLRLKVVRPVSSTSFSVTGVSEMRIPVANALSTFPTRIPVVAGDRLALYVPAGQTAPCVFGTADSGDVVAQGFGAVVDLGVGGTHSALGSATNSRIDVSATVEPDSDGDGYGDETQDGCPGRADRTNECTPPDTVATGPKTVRTTKKKAKVTLLFVSETGARFTCTVDRKAATPCTSPFKVKLKVGKHRIAVTAVDTAGNSDPTPAQLTIKVRRRPSR